VRGLTLLILPPPWLRRQDEDLGHEVQPSSILRRSAFVNAYPNFYKIASMALTHREENMYFYFKPCTWISRACTS
jgi:hypothetical protein